MVAIPEEEPVHILDLPQLYTRPACDVLTTALNMLAIEPPAFSSPSASTLNRTVAASHHEITTYLTRIISSALSWLSDAEADNLRDLASRRLTERSGRTAMASLTRTFSIPVSDIDELKITLHEPALTGDNLGHKTWSSSYAVAKLLPSLLPILSPESNTSSCDTTLELGAGTGLLGLAYAALTMMPTVLTDLEEIVPNLARNIESNTGILSRDLKTPGTTCAVLDWTRPLRVTSYGEHATVTDNALGVRLVLAADPIYSPDHPALLVNAIAAHLLPHEPAARVLLAYPVSRTAYLAQLAEMAARLEAKGLRCLQRDQIHNVRDDWDSSVTVEWAVYGWAKELLHDNQVAS